MKCKILKIISLCLALITILSIPSFAADAKFNQNIAVEEQLEQINANSNDGLDNTISNDDIAEPDKQEDSTLDFDEASGDTIVGKMYICTQQVGLGHAWIYIESNFNGDMPVGCYTLKPYQGVSMGTFCFSRSDGPGLYYNIESYCGNKYGLKNKSWLGMDITKTQLLKISKRITQWNYWDLYFNCTFFAAEIWNCVAKKKIAPILFPFFVKWQILAHGGNKDIVMKDVAPTDCYKQKGVAGNVRIEQVSEKSLDSKLL